MAFELEKLFVDVFAPVNGDVVTVVYDLPHGEVLDRNEWQERRKMAESWHRQIAAFSKRHGLRVNPIVTYDATGSHHSDMPEYGLCEGERIRLEEIIGASTIVLSMPEYSASSHLMAFARSMRTCALPACR